MRGKKSFIAAALVAAIAGVVLAAVAASGDGKPQAQATDTPRPPVTHNEKEWKIVTPAGWTRADATSTTDAKKAVRYVGPDGEFVIVAIDPLGSDYVADTVWRYAARDDGFEIVAKEDCTGTVEQGCSTGDARFDGYVMWKSGSEPKKVGGHVWYFMFGNAEKTTIDPAAFEEILESIRVQA
ncbi:MAG TPA: hypothetical protein VJ922_07435 [Actinomycetota bacterium]|nr:hypothetical protein [Actinomycetota bacterium]